MYVATMTYYFRKELFDEACKKWYDIVLSKLVQKEGFVGGMLMTKPDGKAVAIGFWEDKSFADRTMQSGIMNEVMKDLGEYMTKDPIHEDFEVTYYKLR